MFYFNFRPYVILYLIPCSSSSYYLCFFLLLFWREPSHLLNHLVKFVSSRNLHWVSPFIVNHNLIQVKILKTCKRLKSTHIMWYSEHGYFVLNFFELIFALKFQHISIMSILSSTFNSTLQFNAFHMNWIPIQYHFQKLKMNLKICMKKNMEILNP